MKARSGLGEGGTAVGSGENKLTEVTREPWHTSDPETGGNRFFAAGVFLKGLDGLAEVTGGLLLLLLDPARIHRFALRLAQPEAPGSPKDFIAVHLLHAASTLTGSTVLHAAL